MDPMDPEELELLLLHEEGGDDGLVDMDYHTWQLLSYEKHTMTVDPCQCHRYGLVDPGMSINICAGGGIFDTLWAALQDDLSLTGPYFVSSWICSNFYHFCPVFMDRSPEDIPGMMIFVPLTKRRDFVRVLARLGEGGCIPCLYLRKVEVDNASLTVKMYTEPWWGTFANVLYHWQKTESKRLCGTSSE
ncbi:hypothetical protein ORF15 [Aviadenovirus bubonis]|nr:hypothetical protein ORF15 [Owl adenovirus]